MVSYQSRFQLVPIVGGTPTPDDCHFDEKVQHVEACCFADTQDIAQNAQSDKLQSSAGRRRYERASRSVGVPPTIGTN